MELEKFKKEYRPIRQHSVYGLDKYLLNPLNKEQKIIIFGTYEMYVWSYLQDGSIVNGRRPATAVAYIITENNHDVEEQIIVTTNN